MYLDEVVRLVFRAVSPVTRTACILNLVTRARHYKLSQ